MKQLIMVMVASLLSMSPVLAQSDTRSEPREVMLEFDERAIVREANRFFGETSRELADLVSKLFAEHGRPNGFIAGEELSGSVGLGLRVGKGVLTTVSGRKLALRWEGPSVGIDFGADASKVLILVYELKKPQDILQRFTGVEGSLYFIAGVGANYMEGKGVQIAPIRSGVGWRQGANVGFLKFRLDEKSPVATDVET